MNDPRMAWLDKRYHGFTENMRETAYAVFCQVYKGIITILLLHQKKNTSCVFIRLRLNLRLLAYEAGPPNAPSLQSNNKEIATN